MREALLAWLRCPLWGGTVLLCDAWIPGSRARWCLSYDFYGGHRYQHYLKPTLSYDPTLRLVEHVEGASSFQRARREA